MDSPHFNNPERGGCLTLWLVLASFANPLLALYYLANGTTLTQQLHLQDWAIPVYVAGACLNTFWVLGIWQWKGWALLGLLGTNIFAFALNFFLFGFNGLLLPEIIGF